MQWMNWIKNHRMARLAFVLGPLCFGVLAAGLFGGVIPGRWEKLEAQDPGLPVRLKLASGEELTGIFQGATPEELQILEVGGVERKVPKSSVSKVETRFKIPDPVDNGIAIGTGVGVVLGAAGQGAGDFNKGETIVMMGLLGASVGYLVDRARENPETLYRSR